jgi:hypothetical protein
LTVSALKKRSDIRDPGTFFIYLPVLSALSAETSGPQNIKELIRTKTGS